MKRIFVTGSAGFIGYHLCKELLDNGFIVHGFDAFTDYYDVNLKRRRNQMLLQNEAFSLTENNLENQEAVMNSIERFEPDAIVHLAAQAGVRYSLENPRAYLDSNIVGSFNILEAAKAANVSHLLMASTSSVYGANEEMPYREIHKADRPLTFYAATKKANEVMAHSYSHLWELPITMFRFFTVYGPWGRPDMALFKFVKGIIEDKPIDIYNNGNMFRDFTYVVDLVKAIRLLISQIPNARPEDAKILDIDTLTDAAPFRIVNIGNSTKVRLLDFVDAIEVELGRKAIRNYMEMQMGDVPATWADASLLEILTGYKPDTSIEDGVKSFVDWYKSYYGVTK